MCLSLTLTSVEYRDIFILHVSWWDGCFCMKFGLGEGVIM